MKPDGMSSKKTTCMGEGAKQGKHDDILMTKDDRDAHLLGNANSGRD